MFWKPPCWFSLAGNVMAMAFLVVVITAVRIIDCIYTYLNTEQVIKFKLTLYLLLIWVWYTHTFHMYIYHASLNSFGRCSCDKLMWFNFHIVASDYGNTILSCTFYRPNKAGRIQFIFQRCQKCVSFLDCDCSVMKHVPDISFWFANSFVLNQMAKFKVTNKGQCQAEPITRSITISVPGYVCT